jgi:hypothetical protein
MAISSGAFPSQEFDYKDQEDIQLTEINRY